MRHETFPARIVPLGMSVVCALAIMACSAAQPREDAGGAESGPCAVVVEEVSDLLLYAKGCIATVDGDDISPREFNMRARIVTAVFEDAPDPLEEMDVAELEGLRDGLIEEVVKGEVLTRELDRLGFTIDEAEHRRLVTSTLGPGLDYETYRSYYSFVTPGVTFEEIDVMHRGWSRARSYVCSVRSCEVTREQARARHLEEREASGSSASFEEVEVEVTRRLEEDAWVKAHGQVMAPLMARSKVETFPGRVVLGTSRVAK